MDGKFWGKVIFWGSAGTVQNDLKEDGAQLLLCNYFWV